MNQDDTKKIVGGFIAGFFGNKISEATSNDKKQIVLFNNIMTSFNNDEKEKLYDFIAKLKERGYSFEEFINRINSLEYSQCGSGRSIINEIILYNEIEKQLKITESRGLLKESIVGSFVFSFKWFLIVMGGLIIVACWMFVAYLNLR